MRILLLLGGIGLLIAFMHWRFPYAMRDNDDIMNIVYFVALLLPFILFRSSTMKFKEHAPMILGWLVVFGVLIGGYAYKDVLLNNPIGAALLPNRPQVMADGSITIRASEGGHFNIEAEVNGALVNFMVDTGATDVVLSPHDAERAGFPLDELNFDRFYSTANGVGKGASVTLDALVVGPVIFNNVNASVNEAGMDKSLLGMSFLRRFQSYNVVGDTLTLVP